MEEKTYQYIEDLVRSKSYDELNPTEKGYIDDKLSEEEYTYYYQQLHHAISFYQKEEENLSIREDLKEELLEVFDSKYSTQANFFDWLSNLLFRPITYQISGIGIAILFILIYLTSGQDQSQYDISDEEFIQYTQFIHEEMPTSNTTEQLENMDFLNDF